MVGSIKFVREDGGFFSGEKEEEKGSGGGEERGPRGPPKGSSSSSSKGYMIYNSTSPSPSPATPCLRPIPGDRTGLKECREGEMRRRKRPWQGS